MIGSICGPFRCKKIETKLNTQINKTVSDVIDKSCVPFANRNQRLSDHMQKFSQSKQVQIRALSVADPALELQGWGGKGGFVLLALATFSPSVISYFTQNEGAAPGSLH